ncbi:MAG: Ni/Fe hydrogenase subunit alpha [Desulfobacteraceae bacterium]|nr:Ni/Fe hydrogenase subunit alpha [Desulfobacteraceae bacterium]
MSGKSIQIDNRHVTRIEGHGNIVVQIEDGEVKKVEWKVPEAPRFFEALVVGRDWSELTKITSRICGICSIGHTFASLKATETAMGITITEQTRRLREVLTHGETLQSHILHVCYLVLPDLLKVGSVVSLIETHRDVVLLAIKLHRLANETCDIIGGRTTHPVRACVNGWSMLPQKKELEELKGRYVEAIEDLRRLAEFIQSHCSVLPDFERETEYISLTDPKEYAFYDGRIKSSDLTESLSAEDYRQITNEYVSPQSTAKWTRFNRNSYSVGALARYNNNHNKLTELSKSMAGQLGLSAPCYNPFMNNMAQVAECVYAVEKIAEHIEWLIDKELTEEDTRFTIHEGHGVGAIDVPRGTLFHDYTYDKNGKCVKANLVIPTNQNHANIQFDMEKIVPLFKDSTREELQFILEMLVRAYDPCISCSTHCVHLQFT